MKVAFLGVGHWHAAMHADAVRLAGGRILAAWDEEAAATRRFGERFGGATAASPDAAVAGADLVVVMGRPAQIAARGLAVLEAGRPLLCEKPIGLQAGDVDTLIDAAARRGLFAAVALPHALVMDGARAGLEIGTLSHSHFALINGPPQRYVDDGVGWMLDPAVSGGGALRNLGVHGMHAFLWLAGDAGVRVEHATFGRAVHDAPVEDYACVTLRAGDGAIGIVEAGYCFASMTRGLFSWRIAGRAATLVDRGESIEITRRGELATRRVDVLPPGRRYEAMMADVFARLSDGRPPAVTLSDARRAMALIDEAYAMRRN
jgi:predicted dehydrogenase